MRIPQKVNTLFWCSIELELQRPSGAAGFILRMWPQCSLLQHELSYSISYARSLPRLPIWDKILEMIPYSDGVCFLMGVISALFICQSVWSVEASAAPRCEPVIVSVPFWPSRCFACERTWKRRRERWINSQTTFCFQHFWLQLPLDNWAGWRVDSRWRGKREWICFSCHFFFSWTCHLKNERKRKNQVAVKAPSANQLHAHLSFRDFARSRTDC